MNTVKSIRLAYKDGSSDKVYHAAILEDGGKYSVAVEWGRRGSTLSTGDKAKDTTLEKAEAAFEKIVREKTAKGYAEVPGEDGRKTLVGLAQTGGREVLGEAAQLLNPIDEDDLQKFLLDDDFVAQRKYDGVRILAHIEEKPQFTNRKGQTTVVAQEIEAAVSVMPKGTILDGELLPAGDGEDSIYWVFDILRLKGESAREVGYSDRHKLLSMLLKKFGGPAVKLAPLYVGPRQKKELVDQLREHRAEGVVFKKADAPYVPGRPNSGGNQLKLKFTKTADVFLTGFDGKAYQMAVMHDGKVRLVGKVYTGTTAEERRQLDWLLKEDKAPVVEVRYLYATEGDILFQPVYVRLRPNDKSPEECRLSQLVRTNREVGVE
jgi:bifunctional non-homologous end joining protein LigD